MIRGIGIDLVELERLAKALERHGEHFLAYVLTPEEMSLLPLDEEARLAFLGGRWAAKEAVAKVLGTGFGRRCGWQEIQVLPDEKGAPQVILRGNAGETALQLGIRKIWISISHERHFAVANALAEG